MHSLLDGEFERTGQQHERMGLTGPQIDRSREEMECRSILLHMEMDETQIVKNFPIKWGQVVSSFQTRDPLYNEEKNTYFLFLGRNSSFCPFSYCYRHKFSFPKKTHAHIIPQSGGVGAI